MEADGTDRGLTHVDERGHAHMVDVAEKPATAREARAVARVHMASSALEAVAANRAVKGDVLAVARVAGIMGAKRTWDLVPLCHQIPLSSVAVDCEIRHDSGYVEIRATCKTLASTGVEMEAMTAVSIAALTVYDMCKSMDRSMVIDGVRVLRKSGGRSGTHVASD